MKSRIEDILDKLNDEMNIQPVVYNLFERSDPQEVKKTIESLQRALEVKNEEVKKSLSANHEHLFSCTDLVEQLRQFSKVSSANIAKIKQLNATVEGHNKSSTPSVTEAEAMVEDLATYDVSEYVYYEEIMNRLYEILDKEPVRSLNGFIELLRTPNVRSDYSKELKAFWIKLLTKACKLLKASLLHGKPITRNFSMVFEVLFVLPEKEKAIVGSVVGLSKLQPPFIFMKSFGLSNLPQKEKGSPFTLADLFESLMKSSSSIDPIETIKLFSYLDSVSILSVIDTSQINVPQLFNEAMRHKSMLVDSTNEVPSTDVELTIPATMNGTYLPVYLKNLKSLVGGVNLVDTHGHAHKQHEEKDGPRAKFRFDFVKRYHETQKAIDWWEESSQIPTDLRLGNVIQNNWKNYCIYVLQSLQDHLDFLKITLDFPDQFRSTQESTAALNKIGEDIKGSLDRVKDLLDPKASLHGDATKIDVFLRNALENFNEAVNNSLVQLFDYIEKKIETKDLRRRLKCLFLASSILNCSEIQGRLNSNTESLFQSALQNTLQGNKNSFDLALSTLETLFEDLKQDYREKNISYFTKSVLTAMNQTKANTFDDIITTLEGPTSVATLKPAGTYTSFQIEYPSLCPFVLSAQTVPSPTSNPISVTAFDYDGFIHEEVIAESLP